MFVDLRGPTAKDLVNQPTLESFGTEWERPSGSSEGHFVWTTEGFVVVENNNLLRWTLNRLCQITSRVKVYLKRWSNSSYSFNIRSL